jgi:hypothetical protein
VDQKKLAAVDISFSIVGNAQFAALEPILLVAFGPVWVKTGLAACYEFFSNRRHGGVGRGGENLGFPAGPPSLLCEVFTRSAHC